MELVEAINASFVEIAMKALMHEDLFSLKRENKRGKSDEDDFPSVYPDDLTMLSTLKTHFPPL
jgi:hypothetical protein